MFMRMIYDDGLAQAAYLIGCERSGEAIIIDPERDVDRYLAAAREHGLRITAAAETHIHADFLSGSRELAERAGATVHLSAEGGDEWAYRWPGAGLGRSAVRLLRDGDRIAVGGVELIAVHTPGHTPEHLCFLVIDRGGGADEPMGVLSGDFVFVGDVGRPDLLESAVGRAGAARPAAEALFRSVQWFARLPDHVQVWPAHGAGSACGKALGAVPQSTVGYEKRHSAALRAAGDARAFVDFVLSGQPEPPAYFARMKRQNRDGPPVLGALPDPRRLAPPDLAALDGRRIAIVDTRAWRVFAAGHLPGSLYLPLSASFTTDAGSFIRPEEDIVLLVDESRVHEAIRCLVRVGLDRVAGWADPSAVDEAARAGAILERETDVDVDAAAAMIRSGSATALDVRRASEFAAGHAPGALNIAHTGLIDRVDRLARGRRVVVNCRSGGRSARAVAFLRRAGFDAVNVAGGFDAWERAALPVER